MPGYRNVLEILVEEDYDRIADELDCCTCERCRNDVIAYALNKLPPKYVVTAKGGAYTKLELSHVQKTIDIVSALTLGANIVKKAPNH